MKKILVVTGTRAEYGLLYWTMKEIQHDRELKLQLIVTGNHLAPEYGMTVNKIEEDGFKIDEKIDMIISSKQKNSILKSMGLEMIQMAQSFERLKPDVLLILGDRYETFVAATCAMMMNVPIAHMNGGESTEGIIDEQIRHAITKMAHIHFPGNEYYKKRILNMGEEPWRVKNVGQAGVENIKKLNLLSKEELEKQINIKFEKKILLVTYHPVTLDIENIEYQINQLLSALSYYQNDVYTIFTYPNADFGSKIIIDKINEYVKNNTNAYITYSLGQLRYLSLLKYTDVMIGNSSSGIIESPIFKVPVVNIGDRQQGRIKNKNIIDTWYDRYDIKSAIDKALYDDKFKKSLMNMQNSCESNNTSKDIVKFLKEIKLDKKLMLKKLTY